MRSWIVLLSLVGLLGVCLSLDAQEVEDPEIGEDVFVETVEVNVVNVEVYVTDKSGEPIRGLTKDDFEVFEDGRPVAITNFLAVEGGSPVGETAPETPTVDEGGPPALPERAQAMTLPEDQRLYLVIYIDNFNIRPFNRNRVFRRLRQFLSDTVTRHDRVMLVSYDRSLHVRHPFTSDPQLINSELFELETVTGHAVHLDSERRDLLRDIDEAEAAGEVDWRVRQFAESQVNDLSFSIDAMKEIVDSLGGLPGRKSLVYVSDGLAMTPGEDLYYAINQKFSDSSVLTRAREFDLSRKYLELASRASSNRVVFYTIDAAGLRPPAAADVQTATAGTPGLATFVDSVNISNLQAPLILLAEQTGGQAIYNTNDVGPRLQEVAEDFRSYYSLGYSPAHSGTGRLYKIKVEVKDRKGLKVRHRTRYRDKPLLDRMTDAVRANLTYGVEQNPLSLQLRIGTGVRSDKGLYDVPILVGIPLDSIVLVPLSEIHEGRLRLYFSAMDEEGDMSDVQELNLPVRIPNDQIEDSEGKYLPFQTQLRMRSGPHRVTVGIWDEVGAVGSFVSEAVNVGSG